MKRLMVVEDSAAMRGLIASILGQLKDAEVVEATSGFDALRRLPREKVDLIVVDINMPDINGLELLSFVRKNAQHASTPVIIVTTEGSEEDRRRGMALGANAYLVKPFAPEALLAAVRGLLKDA
ncbi:MAG: response regulator [Deltaproteobacteria bacterium]|nr:response regulator [Deltaproteobacteria bacterium]